jgi:hypothetical protein
VPFDLAYDVHPSCDGTANHSTPPLSPIYHHPYISTANLPGSLQATTIKGFLGKDTGEGHSKAVGTTQSLASYLFTTNDGMGVWVEDAKQGAGRGFGLMGALLLIWLLLMLAVLASCQVYVKVL